MVMALEEIYSYAASGSADVCIAVIVPDTECPVEFPFEVKLNITGKVA